MVDDRSICCDFFVLRVEVGDLVLEQAQRREHYLVSVGLGLLYNKRTGIPAL